MPWHRGRARCITRGRRLVSPERSPRPLVELLHLTGLWNIAAAQPVFDILARSPEFFVAHDARAVNVWAFVILTSLVAPLALWGAVRGLSRLAPAAGPLFMAVSFGGLLLLTVLYAVKQSGGASPGIAFMVAGVCAVAGAVSYVRYAPVRLFVTLLGLAIIVVPAAFLLQCSAPGFLDSGLKVITSTLPRPVRRNRVALGLDSDSRTSPASTARCTSVETRARRGGVPRSFRSSAPTRDSPVPCG